jgi:hypothetical protein
VAEPPIVFEKRGFTIRLQPRASYRITGYALDTSSVLLDKWDFAMPLDVALGWGPVAQPSVLRELDVHLSRRYVSWWYRGRELSLNAIKAHVANNHLIPKSPEIEAELRRIRSGHLVTLRGKLVDVEIADETGVRFHSPTSLVRTDEGSGACEQIWVEEASVE